MQYPPMLRAVWLLCCLALALVPAAVPAQSLFSPPAAEAEPPAEAAGLTPEQAEVLTDLLRDEAAREALIRELQDLAAGAGDAATEAATGADAVIADALTAEAEETPFVRKIAQQTQEIAEEVAANAVATWEQLARAPAVLAGVSEWKPGLLLDALGDLALVILATVVLFVALRMFAKPAYRWMGVKAQPMGFAGTALVWVASVVLDALVVVVAWAAGYALAAAVFGEFGQVGIRQVLYLNAFLTVELTKVAIRAILSPATSDLRPVQIPDKGARVSWKTLNIAVSLVGYGQLLIVPIARQNASYMAARGVSAVLLLLALVVVAYVVLRYRRAVSAWLLNEREDRPRSGFWRMIVRIWHVPVLIYLLALFLIVVTQPGDVLLPVLAASIKILLAIVLGAALQNLVKHSIARGVRLPQRVNERLPMLERRLNAFVPRALLVLRILIIAAVVAFTLHTLGVVDIGRWVEDDVGARVVATAIGVLLIIVVAFALWLALSSWVDYRLNPEFGTIPTARESTLLSLLRNAATVLLATITLMFVLSEMGIDIAPLIASAGVIGLAIGFGAQKLVQDIITGVFIQLENAINVGDVITVGGTSGVVENLTVRSVSLRDLEGVYHIIPFSSVDMVSNFMREFAFVLADIGIAYRESVDDGKQAMLDAFELLKQDPDWGPQIIGDIQWFGVQAFGDSAVVLRARIKSLPGQQWGLGRAYNELVKRIFDERGIEIPFPHRTIYFGELKDGSAPPARVAVAGPSGQVPSGGSGPDLATDRPAGNAPEPGDLPPLADGDDVER